MTYDQYHPIDGDPDALDGHSSYYRLISEAVRQTVTNLNSAIDSTDTVSDAVSAFAEVAAEVSSSLSEVDERYEGVADQLAVYATELRRLQQAAAAEVSARDAALSDQYQADANASYVEQQIHATDPQDPARIELAQSLTSHQSAASDAQALASAAAGRIEALIEERRTIAQTCAAAIQEMLEGSSLNDSAWDQFAAAAEKFLDEHLPIIEKILDIAAIVLTVAAFLVVLTGVGAALAPALLAVARGVQLLSRALKVLKVALNVVLVVGGKRSPLVLADLAADVAADKIADKVVGRVSDAVGAMIGPSVSKHGDDLARRVALDSVAANNIHAISADGMDDWIRQSFPAGPDVPGDSWFSTIGGIDKKMPDSMLGDAVDLGMRKIPGIPAGPTGGLEPVIDIGGDFVVDVLHAMGISDVSDVVPDLDQDSRPSAAEVLAAT